jgi:putative serine protease PepD
VTTGQEPYPPQPAQPPAPPPAQPQQAGYAQVQPQAAGHAPGSPAQPAPPLGPFPPTPMPPAPASYSAQAPMPHSAQAPVPHPAQGPGSAGTPAGQATGQHGYPVPRQATSTELVPVSGGYPPHPAGPQPAGGPQFGGYPPAQPPKPKGRPAWPGITALALAVLLLGLVIFQALQIRSLNDRLAEARSESRSGQETDNSRFSDTDKRLGALESELGAAFNAEKIAKGTLPSVFRVKAGDFTGTAFAVGQPAAGGGTNLFTNAHVIEQVWERGGRQVTLERQNKSFPATIVEVDFAKDVAHLKTTYDFVGLKVATEPVKPGQQVVVVGAPLGLEDTVTSGVVSAIRSDDNDPAIQFDAAINPGNSGGPVINASQQVVGIATAKARNAEGIGLAIPIAVACAVYRIC